MKITLLPTHDPNPPMYRAELIIFPNMLRSTGFGRTIHDAVLEAQAFSGCSQGELEVLNCEAVVRGVS